MVIASCRRRSTKTFPPSSSSFIHLLYLFLSFPGILLLVILYLALNFLFGLCCLLLLAAVGEVRVKMMKEMLSSIPQQQQQRNGFRFLFNLSVCVLLAECMKCLLRKNMSGKEVIEKVEPENAFDR